jgi:hypothetical protein
MSPSYPELILLDLHSRPLSRGYPSSELPTEPPHRNNVHSVFQSSIRQPRAQDNAAVPVDDYTTSNRLSLRLDIAITVGKVLLS